MRIEKISTNQPNFEGKNYKSIFNRFTNMFAKSSSAKAEKVENTFQALAGASTAIALAAIAINKKQEEDKEAQVKEEISAKEEIKQPKKTLDEIFPDLPEVSEPKLQALERKIRYDERSRYVVGERMLAGKKREIQLVNKLLDDDSLINNPKVRRNMSKLIFSRGRELSTKQAKVVDYIMSNPRLYNNDQLVDDAKRAIYYVDESNINSVLRVLSDERFDKTYFYAYGDILDSNAYSDNPQYTARIREAVVDKFLSDERLYNNANICNEISHITYFTKDNERLGYVNGLFDKYLNTPDVFKNKHIKHNIAGIVESVDDKRKFDLANRFFDTPELYRNRFLLNGEGMYRSGITSAIRSIKTPEDAHNINEFLDLYLSNGKFYKNDNLNGALGYILETTDNDNLKFRKSLLRKYLNNPEIQNSEVANNLGLLLGYSKNEMGYKLVDQVFSDERLYNNKAVVKKLPDILKQSERSEDINYISKMLDKDEIISDKKLIDNITKLEWFMSFSNKNIYQLRSDLLDKVLSEKRLYSNKDVMYLLPQIIENMGFYEQYEIAETVLNYENLFNDKAVLGNLPSWLNKIDGFREPNMKVYYETKAKLNDMVQEWLHGEGKTQGEVNRWMKERE